MKKAAFATLGCKVNQCESAYLREQLAGAGFTICSFAERVDIYCINTCAVTGRAAMQSRQLIRRAIRQSPKSWVVAMGCYPQVAPGEIVSIPGVTHILGTVEKLELLAYLSHPRASAAPSIHLSDARTAIDPLPLTLTSFPQRTRAFLKIQDGCDALCSYCIVPHARGRSRSIALGSVLAQLERFLEYGRQEVVLTGVHLGQWGSDLEPRHNLVDLIRTILDCCPPPRLRLSSLEPGEISLDLLELMAKAPEICPHLHIPLQSGDAVILRRMNRHYHPTLYHELVSEAVCRIPDLAVGADVLVGFPGETDRYFHNTCRFIESLPIAYLHVFPFSPRPRTPAATMKAQVAPAVIRERCRLLRKLDRAKRLEFAQRFLGQIRPVLVENRRDFRSGMSCGFSDNYLPVLVQDNAVRGNEIIMARFDHFRGARLVAVPV